MSASPRYLVMKQELCNMHKTHPSLLTTITILTNELTRLKIDVVTKRAEERVTFTHGKWVEVALFLFGASIVRR